MSFVACVCRTDVEDTGRVASDGDGRHRAWAAVARLQRPCVAV